MDRKEFISLVGIGAVSVLASSQFASCSKDDDTGIDFTLDLSASGNSALLNPGGYLVKNGIIIAKTLSGSYIAVSAKCTHEGTTVEFVGSENRFHCPSHDSRYTTTGAIINGPAPSPLTPFNTELNGNILRIFA